VLGLKGSSDLSFHSVSVGCEDIRSSASAIKMLSGKKTLTEKFLLVVEKFLTSFGRVLSIGG